MLAALLLVFAATPAPEQDVAGALASLSAPHASERRDAERWLAAHMSAGDYPTLAEFLGSAGVEARLRLVSALGGDARHFPLALLCALDRSDRVRAAGEEALSAMVEAWQGVPDDPALPPMAAASVLGVLQPKGAPRMALRMDSATLDTLVDRLARRAGGAGGRGARGEPVELALDAGLALAHTPPSEKPDAEPVAGTWAELVAAIAAGPRTRCAVFAPTGAHPWVCIARANELAGDSQSRVLLRWCREVAVDPPSDKALGAARALAASGFPPALAWLAGRWRDQGDERALAGLVLAAGRGRVAPELANAAGVRALLARADAALERGPGEAAELARALVAIGPRAGDGGDLAQLYAAGWATLAPRAQRLRLQLLAALGIRPAELDAALAKLLAAREQAGDAAGLALDALLLAAAAPRPDPAAPVAIGAPSALLAQAGHEGRRGEFSSAWLRLGLALPPEWKDPAAAAVTPARACVLEILIGAGADLDVSAAHLAGLSRADREGLAALLAAELDQGRGERVAAIVARAAERAPSDAQRDYVERAALLGGALPAARHAAVFERLTAQGPISDADAPLIGALAAGPSGTNARAVIVQMLELASASAAQRTEFSAGWVRALERAVLELRRAGADSAATELLTRARQASARAPMAILSSVLSQAGWPEPPIRRPRDLDREDRWPVL